MDKELNEDAQVPYGLLTGVTFNVSTQEITVRTFLLMYGICCLYSCVESKIYVKNILLFYTSIYCLDVSLGSWK